MVPDARDSDAAPHAAAFCPKCGAPRDTSSAECPRCAKVESLNAAAAAVAGERPLRAPLALYFVILGVHGVSMAAAMILEDSPATSVWIDWIVSAVDTLIVLLFVAGSWKLVAPGLAYAGRWWWYPAALGLAGLTYVIASTAIGLLQHGLGIDAMRYGDDFFDAGFGWTALVLAVAVQPAIVEELMFRGLILPAMARLMPAGSAVLVSAAMFMVLHLSPLSFPHLLMIGLALGVVRLRSGSIYPGMLLHFTHNLLVVVMEGRS